MASALRDAISEHNPCALLDGDEMRKGVCRELGFSPEDRAENIRRCGEIAKLLLAQGITVILAVIAPYQKLRDNLKELIGAENLYTVFVDCPVEVCIQRDPKKNYRKAYYGQLKNYTGIGDAYEIPENPDLIIRTHLESREESLKKLLEFIGKRV